MATLRCPIGVFDPSKEDVLLYLERFALFAEINAIEEDSKVRYLLTLIGPEVYKVLKDLCVPDAPSTKTFDELDALLQGHYTPVKLVSVERLKLRQRKQLPSESVSAFILALKAGARDCEFGAALDENLRDQFICGLRDVRISRRLLGETDLTFTRACEMALSMEVATSECNWLQGSAPEVQAVTVSRSGNRGGGQSGSDLYKSDGRSSQRQSFQKPAPSRKERDQRSGGNKECYRCGSLEHPQHECRARFYTCYGCKKVGHTRKMCRQSPQQPSSSVSTSTSSRGVHEVALGSSVEKKGAEEFPDYIQTVLTGNHGSREACHLSLRVEDTAMEYEVDTGAAVTLISKNHWKGIGEPPLQPTSLSLRAVNNQVIGVMGKVEVQVNDLPQKLVCIVVEGNLRVPLLGRDWLQILLPKWKDLFILNVGCEQFIERLKADFPNVFALDNTAINEFSANICVRPGTVPVFQKPYRVPYALKGVVEKEINQLVSRGVLEPVRHSAWASPVVVVPKPNGGIRLCCDYKRTLNPNLLRDVYPLPTIEDIFSTLADGKCFAVIDLSNAYQQLLLSESSVEVMTVNTSMGLYRVKKLPFGVATAPMIFQSVIDQIISGIEGVTAYQDDVLISGRDEEQCRSRVLEVFARLSTYNVKVNESKCQWLVSECQYLGHKLSPTGISPTVDKVEAITNAPPPKDAEALQSWLGLVNYYHQYLPNAATVLAPLNNLTKKNVRFKWTAECQSAFEATKELLVQSSGLSFYDPKKDLVVTCDASPYGVGSVLSMVDGEGVEKPVFFHSATLTPTQQNYSQLEREALSIIVALRRFHKYLYGRRFKIRTDHRALQFIFDPAKNIPAMTAAKLQRWAIQLSAYDYTIEYVRGSSIGNADGLSRNPLPCLVDIGHINGFSVGEMDDLLTTSLLRSSTHEDEELAQVVRCLNHGWSPKDQKNPVLRPYFLLRVELSVEEGILLRGHRVVIPKVLREQVLGTLHEGHPGVSRIKLFARGLVWWPGIDNSLEAKVASCPTCQSTRASQSVRTQAVWPRAARFWDRVHIDFFEKDKVKYLLLADAYSGWLECWIMSKTDAQAVIAKLRTCFAAFSLPKVVVADNGPPFASEELTCFFKRNGIQFIHSPPYHPRSNSHAERGVRVCKEMLKREGLDCRLPAGQAQLDNVLLNYRVTPRADGVSPYGRVFRQEANTRLSLLRPQGRVKAEPIVVPVYCAGEKVWVDTKGTQNSLKWVPGVVVSQNSTTTYIVESMGRQRVTHVDFMRRFQEEGGRVVSLDDPELSPFGTNPVVPSAPVTANPVAPSVPPEPDPVGPSVPVSMTPITTNPDPVEPEFSTPIRRSGRVRKAPDRLDL